MTDKLFFNSEYPRDKPCFRYFFIGNSLMLSKVNCWDAGRILHVILQLLFPILFLNIAYWDFDAHFYTICTTM